MDSTFTAAYVAKILARYVSGTALPQVTHVAWGDGGHNTTDYSAKPLNTGQTALGNELLRKAISSIETSETGVVDFVGQLIAGELDGSYISEFGVFDADGAMVAYFNQERTLKAVGSVVESRIRGAYQFGESDSNLLKDGILTCNSSTPVTASVAVTTTDVDDYEVITSWQAYSRYAGDIQASKSIASGTLTVSFTNSGSATGVKFAYWIRRKS